MSSSISYGSGMWSCLARRLIRLYYLPFHLSRFQKLDPGQTHEGNSRGKDCFLLMFYFCHKLPYVRESETSHNTPVLLYTGAVLRFYCHRGHFSRCQNSLTLIYRENKVQRDGDQMNNVIKTIRYMSTTKEVNHPQHSPR